MRECTPLQEAGRPTARAHAQDRESRRSHAAARAIPLLVSGLGPAERFARSCRLPPGVRNCCYAIEQVVTRPVVLLTVRRPLAPRSHRQALQQPRMMQPRRHGTAPAEPAQRSAVCVWPRSVWGRVRVLFRPASPLAPRGAARVSRGRSRDESGRVRKTGVARARGQRTRATSVVLPLRHSPGGVSCQYS